MNNANIFIKSGESNLDFLINAHSLIISSYKNLISNGYSAKDCDENKIRDDIVKIAEKMESSLKFEWDTESRNLEKANRIDITLITPLSLGQGFNKRIGIECKIVGEDQYINRNGISSFVSGKYCKEMSIAGIIGFIKSGDINKKIKNIKTKLNNHKTIKTIKNLDSLEIDKDFDYSYQSQHLRISKLPKIDLYHLFLDFTQ